MCKPGGFHRVLHLTCFAQRLGSEIFHDQIRVVTLIAISSRSRKLHELIEPKR